MRVSVTIDLDELADRLAPDDDDEDDELPTAVGAAGRKRNRRRRKHTEVDIAKFRQGKKPASAEEAAAGVDDILEEKTKTGREKWDELLSG